MIICSRTWFTKCFSIILFRLLSDPLNGCFYSQFTDQTPKFNVIHTDKMSQAEFSVYLTSVSIKKVECRRIDAFELWCWRVPWTARSNQSILKEINPEYSLEGLRLKFQYFGHLMWRATSLESTLMVGKIEGRRRRRRQRTNSWMASPTWVWANSGRWWRTGKPGVLQSTGSQRVGHDWAAEQQEIN